MTNFFLPLACSHLLKQKVIMRHKIKNPKKGFKPEIEDGGRRKKMKPLSKEKYKQYYSEGE